MANLISDYSPGKILKEKVVEDQWRQELTRKEEKIDKMQNLTWDELWFFLVKPHNQ